MSIDTEGGTLPFAESPDPRDLTIASLTQKLAEAEREHAKTLEAGRVLSDECDRLVREGNAQIGSLTSRLREMEGRVTELEPAAGCWDALSKCYRITCMGHAGLPPGLPRANGYAHAAFNLWTIEPGHEPAGHTGDEQDVHGRVALGDFMMIAIKNHPLSPTSQSREGAADNTTTHIHE